MEGKWRVAACYLGAGVRQVLIVEGGFMGVIRAIDEVLARVGEVRRGKRVGEWTGRCPGHSDEHPSLSITEKPDGQVFLRCWAGCSPETVQAGLGTLGDSLEVRVCKDGKSIAVRARGSSPKREKPSPTIYEYQNEKGELVFQVFEPGRRGFSSAGRILQTRGSGSTRWTGSSRCCIVCRN
jgi:hypothetical protein